MNRIKELREKQEVKQIDLAKKLNISQGTLSNWERCVHDPDNDILIKLSEVFNVSTDYLLCNTDDPTPPGENADDEVWALREEFHKRPELKILFETSKKAKKEDIEFADKFLKGVTKDDND